MKRILWLLPILVLLTGCNDGLYSGTLIFNGEHVFGPGTHLPGDVFLRAGTVEFTTGSQVSGSVYMLGGSLTANGEIGGDLALLGGSLVLGPEAVVHGDLRLGGGELVQSATAHISGDVMTGSGVEIPLEALDQGRSWDDLLRALSAALLLAGLGALLVRSRPQPLVNVGEAAVNHALVSGALGLLVLLVLPALLVMMAFTVILIPLVMIIGLLLIFLLGYGLVAMGYQFGAWASSRLGLEVGSAVAAFGGTLLLLISFEIPYLGFGLFGVTATLVLGAALLTRLGIRPYVSTTVGDGPPDLSSYARPIQKD